MDANSCVRLLKSLKEAYERVERERRPADIQIWLNNLKRYVREMNQFLTISVKQSEKSRLTHMVGRLKTFQARFKALEVIGGGLHGNLTDRVKWEDVKSVFEGRMRTGVIINLKNPDIMKFLDDARRMLWVRLKNALKVERNLKVNVVLSCKYEIRRDEHIIQEDKFFNTKNEIILGSTNIKEWFEERIREKLLVKMDEFQERDSGRKLIEIINLEVNINKYNPLRGGKSSFVEVPQWIKKKKSSNQRSE